MRLKWMRYMVSTGFLFNSHCTVARRLVSDLAFFIFYVLIFFLSPRLKRRATALSAVVRSSGCYGYRIKIIIFAGH